MINQAHGLGWLDYHYLRSQVVFHRSSVTFAIKTAFPESWETQSALKLSSIPPDSRWSLNCDESIRFHRYQRAWETERLRPSSVVPSAGHSNKDYRIKIWKSTVCWGLFYSYPNKRVQNIG